MDKEHTQGTSSPKSEATKQRLPEISYQLFKEQGFEQVGVRDIAAKAGMTTGAFYYYFKSKADILNHHAKMRARWLFHQVPGMLEGLSPLEKIRQFLGSYLCEVFLDEGWELCESRMFSRYYDKRESSGLASTVRLYCEEAKEQGLLIPDCDVDQMAGDLVLACRGVEYDWCLRHGGYDIHQRMFRLVDMVLSHYTKA